MKLKVVRQSLPEVDADILAIPVFEDENRASPDFKLLRRETEDLVVEVLESGELRGKTGDVYLAPAPGGLRAKRILLYGAGKQANYDSAVVRHCMASTFGRLRRLRFTRVALWPRLEKDPDRVASAAVEGITLAVYDPEEYKSTDRSVFKLQEFSIVVPKKSKIGKATVQRMERGLILAECTNFARHLTNQPGNIINPLVLAEKARKVARKDGLKIEILDEKQLRQKGMNALLGVASGSALPPRMIVLRYIPRSGKRGKHKEKGPLALVGKGVTFDTGGISIKPSQSMEEMKADKAGACAVLGAMQAVARLKPSREIWGIIPAVENMPSGTAQRPGDVVKSFSGKTIEIINTDAEGRLILADALAYARHLGAAEIVDIATLTGACVVALGHICAGLFTSSDSLRDRLMEASRRAGENLWQLPLHEAYGKDLVSDIADLKNSGTRSGGAIYAAKFLQEFVGDTPWAHLDIAGVDLFKDDPAALKGPSGFGVRTLAELCFL
ncbi:MAG TPA: leucyl aminopeptidase [Acidobacteriota bacterium]|jgi:leucyl aminopeptidase